MSVIADKQERGEPLVVVQTSRTVRAYSITEHEARSVDQQFLIASATLSLGTFCFGMLANMWMAATFDARLAVVLGIAAMAFWSIGGWLLRVRRSLLKTIQRESGIEPLRPHT